jgi:RHH-type proline utilization regulon transcriptional repressor/proline dehydrogenase/delta 1-pyrroline-5-carboxylate dehydrogenase
MAFFHLGLTEMANKQPSLSPNGPLSGQGEGASSRLEELTQRYGRDLFARLDGDRPVLFSPRWLDDQLMAWSMDDELIKVQLFRFIDVLPSILDSSAITVRHVKEYFGLAKEKLPAIARWGLRVLPERGYLAEMVAKAAKTNATRLARRFIAGSNVQEALTAVEALRRRRCAFTIDLLGEAVLTEKEADHYQQQYLTLVEGLTAAASSWPTDQQMDCDHQGPMPKVNISVKLSSLYSQFDPIDPKGSALAVKARLRPILRLIRDRGAFVNIDMEQFSFKETTLQIFEEVFQEDEFRAWPHVGIAIQAYLKSCGEDLKRLRDFATKRGVPVWVRLVKGAYWDYETAIADQNDWEAPVFLNKWESDQNYEQQTRFLLENYQLLRPAFGSHNIRSLSHALALADLLGVPKNCIEFQLLYGMADPIKYALVNMGQRVRVYTPYGQLLPGMAYLVRRLLENTANQSFLRASFIEHVSEADLLKNPELNHDSLVNQNGVPRSSSPASSMTTIPRLPTTTMVFKNEAPTDFSQETGRRALQETLSNVRKQLGKTYPLLIAGKSITTKDVITSVNPGKKSEVVGLATKATPEHAQKAVEAASKAFPGWRDRSTEERCAVLDRAADLMHQRRFELSAWIVLEAGKQWREADGDVCEAIDFCRYYAHEMRKLASPQRRDVLGEENEYFYEPRGVTVVIGPWNFPLAIPCGMTAAALVAGNPVILKPAEQTSIISYFMVQILHEAGVPKDVLQFLSGVGEDIGPVLVNHPEVALIVFTGSRAVGLLINQQAAQLQSGQPFVKKVITEMGGKNAIIIDDDADLDQAVAGVLAAAFGYQGQKCSACSRVIVLQSAYETFLNRLVDAAKAIRVMPAEDPGSFVGPVIDEESRQRILRYIEQGKKESRLVYATDIGSLAEQGFFVGPHIFADVPPSARIAQEEIFGPVLAIMKAADLTEALKIANGTEYALTGGLFSRSPANIARVRREFRVGNLYINRKITGALVDRQPFGGFKMSGIGSKAGGPDYLLQFVNPRCITENTMRHGFAPVTQSSDRLDET